jgi:K+-transporting ATPase ATPase C chain
MGMIKELRPALPMLVILSLVTGLIYPLAVTGLAQGLFPRQAEGSLIVVAGKAVGSELIGQPFSDPKYFWGRPSATAPFPYNAGASAGSNQGPTNPALVAAVAARVEMLRQADTENTAPVPVDLVTSSASGLDPHISVAAAQYQARRVARARNLPAEQVLQLLDRHVDDRAFGVLGDPRINVLRLNLALDAAR